MINKTKKSWATLLFSLPFAGVGIGFFLFSVMPSLYDGLRMSAWHEAQATVISSELKSYSGDSTTYEAIGVYDYRVSGKQYTGTRLGISGGADNVGEWHQRMSGKLRSARDNQKTVTIYFSPENPAEAIVDRSLRWGLLGFKMIFVLVFGGAGIGLFYWTIRDHNKNIDTPDSASKPWLGHKDWASATIRSDAKAPLIEGLAPRRSKGSEPNGTYLRTSTRLYGESLMPEGRVEFAKIPVGSNSFDHWELAEYPRPNIPGRISRSNISVE